MNVEEMTRIHYPNTLYVYEVEGIDCRHCEAIKDTMSMLGLPYNVMTMSSQGAKDLGVETVPQVFYGKGLIGGRFETEIYLNEMGMLPLFKPLRGGLTPPTRGSDEAAGMDLYADFEADRLALEQGLTASRTEGFVEVSPGQRVRVPTGWAVMVPKGTYGRIAPRSGMAWKEGVMTMAGVVDRDYRGELQVMLYNAGDDPLIITSGQRVAQLVLEKICGAFRGAVVADLPDSVRGAGGYGSTGS